LGPDGRHLTSESARRRGGITAPPADQSAVRDEWVVRCLPSGSASNRRARDDRAKGDDVPSGSWFRAASSSVRQFVRRKQKWFPRDRSFPGTVPQKLRACSARRAGLRTFPDLSRGWTATPYLLGLAFRFLMCPAMEGTTVAFFFPCWNWSWSVAFRSCCRCWLSRNLASRPFHHSNSLSLSTFGCPPAGGRIIGPSYLSLKLRTRCWFSELLLSPNAIKISCQLQQKTAAAGGLDPASRSRSGLFPDFRMSRSTTVNSASNALPKY